MSGTTIEALQAAVYARESACIRRIDELPKSPAALYGPGIYIPNRKRKLTAIDGVQSISNYLLPEDALIYEPCIWHTDLHEENIFVDPDDPTIITSIIDWQAAEIAPMYSIARQPYFLDHDGLSLPDLARPKMPDNLSNMDHSESFAARMLYRAQASEAVYSALINANMPQFHKAMAFRKTNAFGMMQVAEHVLVDGEAQLLGQILELRKSWNKLPRVMTAASAGTIPAFPLKLTQLDRNTIEKDIADSFTGMQAMQGVFDAMGDLAPEKGLVRHDQYDEACSALSQLKAQIVEQFARTDEEKRVWEKVWPFS